MATERSLIRLAQDSEDVASGLHVFRDGLPRSATKITAIIAELFALSSILREISDPKYPTTARVESDLELVLPTLRRTLDGGFDMFARARGRSLQLAWVDMCDRMERDEGIGLLERLVWYHDFLKAQQDVLQGYRARDLGAMRRKLVSLLDQQELLDRRAQRRSIDSSATSTPRPSRPRLPRTETPRSPTSPVEDWTERSGRGAMPPPSAPDPPAPTSPTFTSSSSQTLNSSHTSYSSQTEFIPVQSTLTHWAQNVFNGQNPSHSFNARNQEPSFCEGTVENTALQDVLRDGFIQALQVSFDHNELVVRLYWRPSDSRARALVVTQDERGRPVQYCTLLSNLKVIRKNSALQLCRLRRDGTYRPWAELNFVYYERMVLFYSTFVAMKRQDSRPIQHDALLDEHELEGTNACPEEELLYASTIRHGQMLHNLRLYNDRGSGVVRLEATASRGPMENVPLWTAFVTRFADQGDADWAQFDGNGCVSLAAMRPPPYVFLSGYEPPKNGEGLYVLKFTSNNDAKYFVEQWTALCH